MFENDELFKVRDQLSTRTHHQCDQEKWDRRFLDLAALVSSWSKDPSTKVGSVIVDPRRRVASVGYNGLPYGMKDEPWILDNRDMRLACTVHAEENAILFAGRRLDGHTLYVYPVPPCGTCAAKVRQVGVTRVVVPRIDNQEFAGRWQKSLEGAQLIFADTVRIDFIEMRCPPGTNT